MGECEREASNKAIPGIVSGAAQVSTALRMSIVKVRFS